MKAVLVRVGVDSTAGGWNAPVRSHTNEFVFVPIPEVRENLRPSLARTYNEVATTLEEFGAPLPRHLTGRTMHLDPDFEHLTYGDKNRRGKQLLVLEQGDLVVFYAGLRAVRTSGKGLVYALVGMFTVAEVTTAIDVPRSRWGENAHTIRHSEPDDMIVRGVPGISGRFSTCIPIGEYRDRSYRVRRDILRLWGGLSVRDGYIQRSARLPWLRNPKQFMRWLDRQNVRAVRAAF